MSISPADGPDPYSTLSEGVRRWIDDHGWTAWSGIQARSIAPIQAGRGALLVAPTASGKTEAALLPLVSRIVHDHASPIALLYVAPLRALINDQVRRAYRLLEENGLTVEWWHSDLSASRRRSVLRRPPHALLTTPESLDVMLSSDAYGHGALLGNVRYVLIDEVHAFVEDDRGAQLVSVLARLESTMDRALQRVALSATIASPAAVATWLSSARSDATSLETIVDYGARGRRLAVGLIPEVRRPDLSQGQRAAEDLTRLVAVLEKHVAGRRAIVFTTSRADAENVTAKLHERGIETYIHHGSVDKDVRAVAEAAFREGGPRTIVATSSLELGIDIGDLELVVQIGSPGSALSLLQRVGRSGRRGDAESVGIVYATSEEELPAALAVTDLALDGLVEEAYPDDMALHVLFQQVIQFVRERGSTTAAQIGLTLLGAGAFRGVSQEAFFDLINEQIAGGFLEVERGDMLVIGPETERRFGYANYRDFYALFEADAGWIVRHATQRIGTLDRAYPIPSGREVTFVLAGRRWRVIHADRERMVLDVEPTGSGAIPRWSGEGGDMSFEVMQRARTILTGEAPSSLESATLRAHMDRERGRVQKDGLAPGIIPVCLTKSGARAATYGGNALNRYLAALCAAAMNGVSIGAHAVDVQCATSADVAAQALERILGDAGLRATLRATALETAPPLGIGRHWPHLGPKTRRHLLRHSLDRGEILLARLRYDAVIVAHNAH
jgi:ATP-dependent helicase Lhr and Lhr-like helicase